MKQPFPKMLYRFMPFLLLLVVTETKAQDTLAMPFETYCRIVRQYHPLIKQAKLLDEMAGAELMGVKGQLDPKLSSEWNEKTFDGKKYFSDWETTLKVPLWWGIDLKTGWETSNGVYLNPEATTPAAGLAFAGISIPLAQGIIIDQRRNTILQARMLPEMAEAERRKLVNKQELQAVKDYWEWAFQQQRYEWMKLSYRLAADRFVAVKTRALLGELPAIDTVEALVAVQDRESQLIAARIDYRNALLSASLHLWNENGAPLEADTNLRAQQIEISPENFAQYQQLKFQADSLHPELAKMNIKIDQLAIEQRFANDKLKPKIYFDYNFLTAGFPGNASLSGTYLSNNYKTGLRFSYSLFIREERSKIRLTQLKIQQAELDRTYLRQNILNGIDAAWNEISNLQSQIQLQQKQVKSALDLRNGEQTRFNNGESSFFLVNTRELGLISSQVKLAELKAKQAKSMAALRWAAGTSPM